MSIEQYAYPDKVFVEGRGGQHIVLRELNGVDAGKVLVSNLDGLEEKVSMSALRRVPMPRPPRARLVIAF